MNSNRQHKGRESKRESIGAQWQEVYLQIPDSQSPEALQSTTSWAEDIWARGENLSEKKTLITNSI